MRFFLYSLPLYRRGTSVGFVQTAAYADEKVGQQPTAKRPYGFNADFSVRRNQKKKGRFRSAEADRKWKIS